MPTASKSVIPAAAKRRAGIHKAWNWLDSRFRGNDDIGVGTPFIQLSSSFSAACWARLRRSPAILR
jgi:hypothetical protein